MAKTEMISARVDAELKQDVEAIFSELGLSVSQGVLIYLKRVQRQRGIPFDLNLDPVSAMREEPAFDAAANPKLAALFAVDDTDSAEQDFLEYLMENPVQVSKDFRFLTREEIYDR